MSNKIETFEELVEAICTLFDGSFSDVFKIDGSNYDFPPCLDGHDNIGRFSLCMCGGEIGFGVQQGWESNTMTLIASSKNPQKIYNIIKAIYECENES